MKLALDAPLDRAEICRYLGCTPADLDGAARALIEECEREILDAAAPRCVFRRFGLQWQAETPRLAGASQALEGRDIARHLAGCHAVLLMASTLGAGVDALLRAAAAGDVARSVVLDAAASVAAEAAAAAAEEAAAAALCRAGEYRTGRFSPGYGDLPITGQRAWVTLLDAPRAIGLAATREAILTPRKSVTALVGVADHPVRGRLAGCACCALKEKCELRKRGTPCGKADGQ